MRNCPLYTCMPRQIFYMSLPLFFFAGDAGNGLQIDSYTPFIYCLLTAVCQNAVCSPSLNGRRRACVVRMSQVFAGRPCLEVVAPTPLFGLCGDLQCSVDSSRATWPPKYVRRREQMMEVRHPVTLSNLHIVNMSRVADAKGLP